MAAVASLGLLANLAAFALLRPGAGESIGVRSASLEVLADLLGSLGVLGAAIVLQLTGWRYADPLVAVGIAAFVLPRTWRLARHALRILLQAAPEGVDSGDLQRALGSVAGVLDVHDVHVWTLTSGMDVASAHLTIADGTELASVLTAARDRLHDEYGIEHATLQVEPHGSDADCRDVGW
jgi:cobalt-zinc-cadmium efflux system protein